MNDRLHFQRHGNLDQPVLLFLHGFLGDCQEFAAIVPQLTDQFCCLCVDLPGHGKTQMGREENYTMPNTAQAIVHLLDRLKTPQAYVAGYSMGGRLALYLALHFPDCFPKVILESASPGLKTEAERSARRQRDGNLAVRLESDFAEFLTEWYEQPLFRSLKQHPHFEALYQQRSQNNPSELAKSLRNLGTGQQPSLWSLLADHQRPLLLLVGEDDRKFVSINQEMQSLCKTAQIKIVREAGHNIHVEKPRTFVRLIKRFHSHDISST